MIENPQKKFKINDTKCRNINFSDIKRGNEKTCFEKKKYSQEECYGKSNTSEWLSSKINDICRNFKTFLKKGENGKYREKDEVKAEIEKEKEKVIQKEKSNKNKSKINTTNNSKKRNKRTYTQFSSTKANKEEKKKFRPLFGYISLLKSLILIYEFYTDRERKDVNVYDLMHSHSKEKGKENENITKKGENLEREIKLERELKKILSEKSTSQWGDEKKFLAKCVNEIFSNTVNEKAGFFFAFNTLFFVDLKKFYYYVDIINTLNFIGENKCIAKENEKDKRMLIFQHVGLYFDKLNTVVINNKKENNFSYSSTLINKKTFEIFKFHEQKNNKQNVSDSDKKEMEQIKENLLMLKQEKSDEEYLYMAMDKCNKEIYLNFLKITNLFRDICEISQNKWDEISWDNTKQINGLKNMEQIGKKEKKEKEKESIKYRIESNIGEEELYIKKTFCLVKNEKEIKDDQIGVKEKLKETDEYDDGKEQKREKKIKLVFKEKRESIMKIFNDFLSKIPHLNSKCNKHGDVEKDIDEANNEKTDNELLNTDETNTNESDNVIEKDESDDEKKIEKKSDKNSNDDININSNNDSSKNSISDSNEEKSQKSQETKQTSEEIDKSNENSVETVSVNNKSEQSEIEDIENTDGSRLTEEEKEMKSDTLKGGDKEVENEKTEKEELEYSEDEKKKETENEDEEIKTVEDLTHVQVKNKKEIKEEKEKQKNKSEREQSDESESNETGTQSSKEYHLYDSESEHYELSNNKHEKAFKNKNSENIRNEKNKDGTNDTDQTDKSSGYLSEDNKNVLSDEEESEETEKEENKEEESEKSTEKEENKEEESENSTENVTEDTFEKATEKEIEEETEEAIEKKIRNFIRKGENTIYNRKYVNYMKKTIVCDGLCCVENHESENKLFVKEVKKLLGLIKNKKFIEHYINEIKEPENLNCWKLRKAYKILLLLIHSIIKETEMLRHHLKDSNNYIFINSGIENYLNEQNISLIEKEIQQNDLFDGYFHENIINDFFFSNRFKTRKKKYIYYESFEQYKILLICLKDIFNDPLMKEQLNKIAYYVELGDDNENYSKEDITCEIDKEEYRKKNNVGWLIPSYIKDFYKKFQIKEEYLKHIQSLFHNSIPTVECFNMFINCLNKNYSKIHENKLFFKYELNNAYLSLFPYVYCCNIQLIKHSDFLNLKESCQNIIKNNKIYDEFTNHLSSFIFEKYYFLLPFYTPYGKFLIVIKTDKSENSCSSYDVIINSFIFPNESSFHAIIHFSHYFIKSLNSFLNNFDFYSNTPLITFSELSDVDKQQILFPEIESQKNKNEIIVNFMFLIDSFFNNVQKIRVPREFNQGLRFLYITRLLEFYYERCKENGRLNENLKDQKPKTKKIKSKFFG